MAKRQPGFRFLDEVLAKIRPDKKELVAQKKLAKALLSRFDAVLPNHVEARLMGSVAKGTDLAGNDEMDIFLLFPKSFSRHHMLAAAFSYIRRAFHDCRLEQRYAEHPYMHTLMGGCDVDLVPAYRIADASEMGTSVDRSQLHTRYINRHLSAQQKDDVRLLKQFAKALDIYGAELRVEGFSGYLSELLILQYGSFISLLENAQNWKIPVYLEPGKQNKPPETQNPKLETQNQRPQFSSPLVVIDPVDENRNVAAVVSTTSLARFIFASRAFLEKPGKRMFFRKKLGASIAQLRKAIGKRDTSPLLLEMAAPNEVDDILWPQLKKTSLAIGRVLMENGFAIVGYYYWAGGGKCLLLYELEQGVLPGIVKVAGPSVSMGNNPARFLAAHKKAQVNIEHDRLVAVVPREIRTPSQAIGLIRKKKCDMGIPEGFRQHAMKMRQISASEFLKKYKEIAIDYFLRDLKKV